MKVLVLEDDTEDWLLLQHQLRSVDLPVKQEVELELASTLSAAGEKTRQRCYDFMIADFHLPDGVALDFLFSELQRCPTMYALLVSNDEQLVTLPAVGELLRSNRVSFCVKSDLDQFRLQAEFRAAQCVSGVADTEPHRKSILLVDDDPDEREMLRWHCEQLTGMEVDVDWARDTGEALRKAAAGHYSLILVDFRLDQEIGTETIRQLQDAGIRAPMFIISDAPSFLASQEAMRCLGHRRAGFISKRRLDSQRLQQVLQAKR